jgi:hypothetical protein
MSAAQNPFPALPPGKPREELLRYFAESWPRGQRIASVKYKDWTPEVDRQREREEADEDDDDRDGGAPPAKRGKAPKSQDEPAPPGTHGPEGILEKCFAINDHELMFVDNLDPTAKAKAIKVEWDYLFETQWTKDERSKEPGWVVKKVTCQKVIVMRVLV